MVPTMVPSCSKKISWVPSGFDVKACCDWPYAHISVLSRDRMHLYIRCRLMQSAANRTQKNGPRIPDVSTKNTEISARDRM